MNLSEKMRPETYSKVLGNEQVKNRLENDKEKKPTILYGTNGCGKSTLARLFLPNAKIYDGPDISNDDIRYMDGQVIIDEIDTMNVAKQKFLATMIDTGRIKVVGTTIENPTYKIHRNLRSRMRIMQVELPSKVAIKSLIKTILKEKAMAIEDMAADYIIDSIKDLRAIIDYVDDLYYLKKENVTLNDISISYKNHGNNTMESLKSAMQKSIRGSDVDASILYANTLMEMGYLEEMCRRLRVIASEDIGLANPNAIVIVDACVSSALQIGMPECKFNVMQAVAFLALQPKSNSIHEAIKKANKVGAYTVPSHIAYVHSDNYKYPHNYPNNYVKQNYLPMELIGLELYEPCSNKIEQGYKEYWKKVKGKE